MNVLQVNKFYYRKGGSEAYLFALEAMLAEQGVTTAPFSMQDERNVITAWNDFFVANIDYHGHMSAWDKLKAAGHILYSREARRKLSRMLDRFPADLAHLHIFQHQLSPSILYELKERSIPVVYTAHDLKSVCPNYKMYTNDEVCERCKGHRYYQCIRHCCVKGSAAKSAVSCAEMYLHYLARVYDMVDLIITPSRFYRDKLVEFRFDADKVVHLPNFVDETRFSPAYDHQGYCLYFGRLSEEKGVPTLVRAMAQCPEVRLVIAGTGPAQAQIEATCRELKLSNVELVGFQSGTDLEQLIAGAMFTVLPSQWYENGSISLLESFACGKPVIGADIGGIPEHITPGEDGLVFAPGDADRLAEAINELAGKAKRLPEMGRAARRKIETVFSRQGHMDRIMDIYSSLGGSHDRTGAGR